MELTDGTVGLRPFVDGDVPAVARACDDVDSARFLVDLPSPYTEEDARDYIQLTRAWAASGEHRAFAIVDSASGELLGSITVHLDGRPSIGYWVAPWARGRGVATGAVRLLSEWALTDGGVERLELTTDPENVASQRVAGKCGFTREGLFPGYLETSRGRRDSVVFSLRRA